MASGHDDAGRNADGQGNQADRKNDQDGPFSIGGAFRHHAGNIFLLQFAQIAELLHQGGGIPSHGRGRLA